MNRTKLSLAGALSVAIAAGCAHEPPQQLVDARNAYRQAEQGPAREQAPAYLDTAKRALARAEQSFQKDGDNDRSQDLAYIARRLAQLADAQAQVQLAMNDKTAAEREISLARSEAQESGQQRLSQTQMQLQQQEHRLSSLQQDLATERQARSDAEKMAQQARDALQKAGDLKESDRGQVLTVSGSVLFTSGKANLRSGAASRLDSVVDALRAMKGQKVVIEGYTDSTGSADLNQRLSERRAEAVADYLVHHGIDRDRVETRGMGADNPIDDNSTPEGRANNRRVEIVFERPTS